jgi:hypothetical protein
MSDGKQTLMTHGLAAIRTQPEKTHLNKEQEDNY